MKPDCTLMYTNKQYMHYSGIKYCLVFYHFPAFREVFDLFDSNGGGTIDAEELDLALKSVDIQLSPDDLAEVLVTMDKDGKELW